MRFFSFGLMIGLAALLGHLYLYRRLVRPLAPSRRWRIVLGGGLATMTLLLLARGPMRSLGPTAAWLYEISAYTWMAVAVCMFTALVFGDLVRLTVALHARLRPPRPTVSEAIDDERRVFLTRTLPWSIVGSGTVLAGYGITRAMIEPEVTELVLRLPKLPPALDGLTLVQLTDIHVGPFIGRKMIDRLVAQTNALRPDLVAITGDLVDGSVPALGPAVAGLAGLKSRYGTYFVTGNHDYYSGADAWTRFLQGLGIDVLRNRRVPIGDAGGTIDLIGVDDWGARRRGADGYDLDTALAGRDPDHAAVLLAHQPANFEQAVAQGIDLQISGHTHGGQLFPMTMLVGLAFDHTRGLYHHGDASIYVSRGCGFWGPPARVGSAPEILKLTLTG